jgi:hypothetical protein
MRRPLRNQNGAALIASFVLLVIMLTLGSAALMSSTFELKSTNHFNTGNQALYAAESGVLDALSIINTNGVADFANDIIPKWDEKFGTEPKTLIGHPGFNYMVTLAADPDNPAIEGMITSVGRAPSNARRIIQARIQKSTIGRGRGALYLAADSVTPTFSGNGFLVDGNDHDQFGALNPDGIVEPGVATRNDDVTDAVKTALDADNWDNVVGLEYSADPPNSSVVTTNGPDIAELDEIVAEMLANPSVVVEDAAMMNGNAVYGTVDSGQPADHPHDGGEIHDHHQRQRQWRRSDDRRRFHRHQRLSRLRRLDHRPRRNDHQRRHHRRHDGHDDDPRQRHHSRITVDGRPGRQSRRQRHPQLL